LDTASIHVTIDKAPKPKDEKASNGKTEKKPAKPVHTVESSSPASSSEMRNVELSSETIQQGFGKFFCIIEDF
jgi:hypothetical protein